MMDFIANELEYDDNNGEPTNLGSYYLPSVIIKNNIRYNKPKDN